jgi:hypothetical protein
VVHVCRPDGADEAGQRGGAVANVSGQQVAREEDFAVCAADGHERAHADEEAAEAQCHVHQEAVDELGEEFEMVDVLVDAQREGVAVGSAWRRWR